MSESRRSLSWIIMTTGIIVLIAVMLVLTVLSARSYNYASSAQQHNSNRRAVLSYIVSSIRDSKGSEVHIDRLGDSECLTLTSASGYERRFYEKDGMLMEEYGDIGFEIRPSDALVIGEAGSLHFRLDDDGLLTILSDAGVSYVDIAP